MAPSYVAARCTHAPAVNRVPPCEGAHPVGDVAAGGGHVGVGVGRQLVRHAVGAAFLGHDAAPVAGHGRRVDPRLQRHGRGEVQRCGVDHGDHVVGAVEAQRPAVAARCPHRARHRAVVGSSAGVGDGGAAAFVEGVGGHRAGGGSVGDGDRARRRRGGVGRRVACPRRQRVRCRSWHRRCSTPPSTERWCPRHRGWPRRAGTARPPPPRCRTRWP